jgi:hypothetical protein
MRVAGVPPWDGDYPLDIERSFNAREWHWITKLSGYLPMTVSDGFAGRDPMLFVAFTVVAMCRARKITKDQWGDVAEQLAEAPFDWTSITLVTDEADEVADELPLESTHPPAVLSPTG